MDYKLFINSNYVYKMSVIESNVDADLINKFIWKSMDLNIQSVLGAHLYTKMLNDCPTYSGVYADLMEKYIKPALCEWTVYHALPFINFRLTNKAVSQKSSDASQPSSVDDIKWLRDQVRNNAEFYNERIKEFIKNNQTALPEYYTTGNPHEIRPAKTAYFSGIQTSGRVRYGIGNPVSKNNIDPNEFNGCC